MRARSRHPLLEGTHIILGPPPAVGRYLPLVRRLVGTPSRATRVEESETASQWETLPMRMDQSGMLWILFIFASISGAAATGEIKDIQWSLGPNFPVLRKGGAFGLIDGKVISASGMEQPWCEAKTAFSLDVVRPTEWVSLPDAPTGRCYVHGVALGDALYVVGGRREGKTLTEGYKFTLGQGRYGGWRGDIGLAQILQ